MSAFSFSSASRWRRLALPALSSLLLALAMIRVPVPMDVDPLTAHRALLYENLRLGRTWAEACPTTEGPLTALQIPAYLSGNLWMAFSWQIAGNLLLASVLVAAAWRLVWPQRAWALVFLATTLARWPELAPWLVITIIGHDLIRVWDRNPRALLPGAVLLGFLALFSLGHLLLAASAILLVTVTARPPLSRILAATGFGLGLGGGWLALGQSPAGFALWLHREWPELWQTSATGRLVEVAPFASWAFVSALGLVAVLVRHHDSTPEARRSLPTLIFVAGSAWLTWKAGALQAYGTPLAFFGAIVLAGFLLWREGCRTRWVAALFVLGTAGLARGHPEFLSNALGHFNRQVVFNSRQLARGGQFRIELRAQVSALRTLHLWPKLSALVGRASVGADASALPRAMLNNLALVQPPDARNGATAPAFVVQRMAATPGQPPALLESASQRALYQNYEPLAEESGVLLWRQRPADAAAVVPVAKGMLLYGEPLKLPDEPGTAYWLELEAAPGLLGRMWSWLDEVSAPGLIVRNDDDETVRYSLPPAALRDGFLVQPLVRGNVEFQRWQRGAAPARTTELTVALPPDGAWLWTARFRYRLYALPGLQLAGHRLPASAPSFRAFIRAPVGTANTLPFGESEAVAPGALLVAHPDSLLEFVTTGADRHIRGSFGLIAGAYAQPGHTDGVDFSVEFIGLDGSRQILLHRYLNPATVAADRGVQQFDLSLPEMSNGRLLFRTYNPPYRSAAWDWAFWQNVVIE